ncbi:MAG: alpha/beta fold hydrolase [Dehalococcoidia bacterium]|nr:alpha/beta fold hydrolase [Dehalococcoidia bacterium]
MTERFIDLNGASLWLSEQGNGTPLMLLNGGPGCCDYLGPVASMIDDLVHVYRYEPRGCGRSSADGPYDLNTTLADLEGLRSFLGIEKWFLAGHSWGSGVALAYALEYPGRVLSLIYLSGSGIQNDRAWHDAYTLGRDSHARHIRQQGHPPQLAGAAARQPHA